MDQAEFNYARTLSPVNRPKNRLQAFTKPLNPRKSKFIPHSLQILQQAKNSIRSFDPVFGEGGLYTPDGSTADAYSLYLHAASAALENIEIIDSSAAQTIQKTIDFFASEARLGPPDLKAALKERDDALKSIKTTKQQIEVVQLQVKVSDSQYAVEVQKNKQLMDQIDQLNSVIQEEVKEKDNLYREVVYIRGQLLTVTNSHMKEAQIRNNIQKQSLDHQSQNFKTRTELETLIKNNEEFDQINKKYLKLNQQQVIQINTLTNNNEQLITSQSLLQEQLQQLLAENEALKAQFEKYQKHQEYQNQLQQMKIDSLTEEIYSHYGQQTLENNVYNQSRIQDTLSNSIKYGGLDVPKPKCINFSQQCCLNYKKLDGRVLATQQEFEPEKAKNNDLELIEQEYSDKSEDFIEEKVNFDTIVVASKSSLLNQINKQFISKKAAFQLQELCETYEQKYKKYKAKFLDLESNIDILVIQRQLSTLQKLEKQLLNDMKKQSFQQDEQLKFQKIISQVICIYRAEIQGELEKAKAAKLALLRLLRSKVDMIEVELDQFDEENSSGTENQQSGITPSRTNRRSRRSNNSSLRLGGQICSKCKKKMQDSQETEEQNQTKIQINTSQSLQLQSQIELIVTQIEGIKNAKIIRNADFIRKLRAQNFKDQINVHKAMRQLSLQVQMHRQSDLDHQLHLKLEEKILALECQEREINTVFDEVENDLIIQEQQQQQSIKQNYSSRSLNFSESALPQISTISGQNSILDNMMLQSSMVHPSEFTVTKNKQLTNMKQIKQTMSADEIRKYAEIYEKRNRYIQSLTLLRQSKNITEKELSIVGQALYANLEAVDVKRTKVISELRSTVLGYKGFLPITYNKQKTQVYQKLDEKFLNPFRKITKLRDIISDAQKMIIIRSRLLIQQEIMKNQSIKTRADKLLEIQKTLFPIILNFEQRKPNIFLQAKTKEQLVNAEVIEIKGEIVRENISQMTLYASQQEINLVSTEIIIAPNSDVIVTQLSEVGHMIKWIKTSRVDGFFIREKPLMQSTIINSSQFTQLSTSVPLKGKKWILQVSRYSLSSSTGEDFGIDFRSWARQNYGFGNVLEKLINATIVNALYWAGDPEIQIFYSLLIGAIPISLVRDVIQFLQRHLQIDIKVANEELIIVKKDLTKELSVSLFAEKFETDDFYVMVSYILNRYLEIERNTQQLALRMFQSYSRPMEREQALKVFASLPVYIDDKKLQPLLGSCLVDDQEFIRIFQKVHMGTTDPIISRASDQVRRADEVVLRFNGLHREQAKLLEEQRRSALFEIGQTNGLYGYFEAVKYLEMALEACQ
eukprot:EST41477.1 hypothetical protein SS50377_19205 [Spironucleus salmonicida]